MAMRSLEDLFIDELKDIYDAEKRITKALPKMARAASDEKLASGFRSHLEQTQEQISRLDRIFENLDVTPGRKTCDAMVGLLEEGEHMMEQDADPSVKDAGLIAAAQKVEHYEIATYGCLRDWAELLGQDEAVRLLQQTLNEEAETDKKLTQIAQNLNIEAAEAEGEEEEETVASSRSRGTGNSKSSNRRTR
jgi:ferritin-like metal-binding protein YciE